MTRSLRVLPKTLLERMLRGGGGGRVDVRYALISIEEEREGWGGCATPSERVLDGRA